jgi:hypothetical protein
MVALQSGARDHDIAQIRHQVHRGPILLVHLVFCPYSPPCRTVQIRADQHTLAAEDPSKSDLCDVPTLIRRLAAAHLIMSGH